MGPVLFTDLDDTLFTTLKSYPGVPLSELRQIAEATNGNHSYLCERRAAILDWLAIGATLIPVTARSRNAYDRVDLKRLFTSGGVLSNGAVILGPDGDADAAWTAVMAKHCHAAAPALEAIRSRVSAAAAEGLDVRILDHAHEGLRIGLTVKSNPEGDAVTVNLDAALAACGDAVTGGAVEIVRNGNNLGFVPAGVSKKAAVEHLLATRPDLKGRPLIGAGDSVSDLPFMKLCDMLIIPRGSQISRLL
ncbi:hypothetical protein LAZ40_01615 [Cereibacter sphaeroides]|uniref:hypothetical protein n=1 Tax=Cereibacter sphaeroides TaxID=1063 RepID=UPI001F434494|nr:hypothetical protein [Cereibacter sphaeroides]MCE6957758.1 hypothetical protein [Cereibacter sphaeroides]MCE6971616.1 hypothetical protein [Cereibacter sphaeroides]